MSPRRPAVCEVTVQAFPAARRHLRVVAALLLGRRLQRMTVASYLAIQAARAGSIPRA